MGEHTILDRDDDDQLALHQSVLMAIEECVLVGIEEPIFRGMMRVFEVEDHITCKHMDMLRDADQTILQVPEEYQSPSGWSVPIALLQGLSTRFRRKELFTVILATIH